MSRAFPTSSAVPCATRTNLPALIDVSYFTTLFLGMPRLKGPAPRALTPPTTIAPSRARDDPVDNGAGSNNGPDAWADQERPTDEHTPEPAPKCAPSAPVFHPVACVVEADDILLRLIVAADDGQLLDVKPTTLPLLDGIFCCRVLVVKLQRPSFGPVLACYPLFVSLFSLASV